MRLNRPSANERLVAGKKRNVNERKIRLFILLLFYITKIYERLKDII